MKDRLHYQTWLWVVMKHSVCQFILATFLISALEARDTHAQNLLERIVTIHLDQTDVGKFVSTLEKATGVEFVYSSKAIGANRKLSVHQINQKLSVVLETTLKPMNIGYRLVMAPSCCIKRLPSHQPVWKNRLIRLNNPPKAHERKLTLPVR
jgi:hypothetical protein